MPTKKAKQKPPAEIFRMPGTKQFQAFLQNNPGLFNLSEIERICGFPGGRLRHIRAGSREMTTMEYKKVQECIMPKLCEAILLLQLYSGNAADKNKEWDMSGDDY